MIAPRIHEMMPDGPASWATFSAPSNQPEPMLAPRDTNISP